MMFQLPDEQNMTPAESWPAVNMRVSIEIQGGIRAEARKLQLTLGEYMVQLYAFGNARFFPAHVARAMLPAGRVLRKTFLVRIPPDIAEKMYADVARRDMKLGDFIEQLFAFGRENNFLEWLDSYDPEK
jgi:hypothetical protein